MKKAIQAPFSVGLTKKQIDFIRKKARGLELSMSAYIRKMVNLEIEKEVAKRG